MGRDARGEDVKSVNELGDSDLVIENQKSKIENQVACPFCASREVELFSLFGSQLLTTEYYCRNCYTVFEQVKR